MARPKISLTVCNSEEAARKVVTQTKAKLRLFVVQDPAKPDDLGYVMAPSSSEAISAFAEQRFGVQLQSKTQKAPKVLKEKVSKLSPTKKLQELIEKFKTSPSKEVQEMLESVTSIVKKKIAKVKVVDPSAPPAPSISEPPPPPV